MRLGQAVGAEQLTAEQLRQPALLLLLGARVEQPEAAQRVHAGADTDRGPRRGDLLEYLEVDLVRLAAATVLLRVGQAQQAGPAKRGEHLPVERVRALGLVHQRAQLLVD